MAVPQGAVAELYRRTPSSSDEIVVLPPPWMPRLLACALGEVPDAGSKTVADLGCGVGSLLPSLAAGFGRVFAIDASPAMLARARAACRARHVSFHRAELSDLTPFRGRLDVAVTVNTALAPHPDHLERVFAAMRGSLRPGGLLIGVFPAMEALIHRRYLMHEHERRQRRGAAAPVRPHHPNGASPGTAPEDVHKRFYGFELRHRLRDAGFRRIRLARLARGAAGGSGDHPELPAWDWLVRASAPGCTQPT